MKNRAYIIPAFLFLFISVLILSACGVKEETSTGISGKLTDYSDCKSWKSDILKSNYPDSTSCVLYFYNENNKTMSLHHFNAGFNCCPGKLSCKVTSSNDTIYIEEFEKVHECDCDCLFDLDIQLQEIEPHSYRLIFIEPYVGDQERLNFKIDLTMFNEGEYCVTRKIYPWGIH